MAASETPRLPRVQRLGTSARVTEDEPTWGGLSWHGGRMGRAAQALGVWGHGPSFQNRFLGSRGLRAAALLCAVWRSGLGTGRRRRCPTLPGIGTCRICRTSRGRGCGPGSADGVDPAAPSVVSGRDRLCASTGVLRLWPDQRWRRLPVLTCPRGKTHQVTWAVTQWPGLERPPVLGARWRSGATAAG